MKKLLLRYLLFILLISLTSLQAFAALTVTATRTTATAGAQGLSAATQYPKSTLTVYGVGVTVTLGTTNITQIVFNSNYNPLSTYFNNAKLYHSTSSTFDGSATQVTNSSVQINSTNFTASGFSDQIVGTTTATEYYYLVVDYIYSGTGNPSANNIVTTSTVTYSTGTASATGTGPSYSLKATTVTLAVNSGGLTSSNIYPTYPTDNTVAVYSISANATGGTVAFSGLTINSNLSTLSTFFTNPVLYTSTSSSYDGTAVPIAGATVTGTTANINGSGNVVFSGMNQNIPIGSNRYFYLVMDYNYAGSTTSTSVNFTGVSAIYTHGYTQTFNSTKTYALKSTTMTVTNNAITAANLYPVTNDLPVASAKIIATGGNASISGMTFSAGNQLSTYYTNPRLYVSSSSTYSGSATQIAGTGFGSTTATVNSNSISFTGLAEAENTSTTNYYYVVVDYVNTGNGNSSAQMNGLTLTFANSATQSPTYSGTNFQFKPATVDYANTNGGITSNSYYPINGATMYGFSAVITSGGAATQVMNTVTITSNTGSLSSLFANAKLYSSNNSSYDGTAVQVAGNGYLSTTANISSGNTISFGGLNETITSTKKYYYLVMDYNYTGTNTNNSFQLTNVAATYASGANINQNANSQNNTLRPATITMSSVTTGLSATTVYSGQQTVAMYGFGVNIKGTVTLTGFNINSTTTNLSADNYFTSGKIYRNTTNTFSGASQVTGTVQFNGNFVNISGMNESFTSQSGQTYYYFLVADDNYTGNASSNITFSMANPQSPDALVPSVGTQSGFPVTGNTYTISPTTYVLTNLTGGLASSSIIYGQTDQGLFGFTLQVNGTSTVNQIAITSSNATPFDYFSNMTLYRYSNTTYHSGTATKIAGPENMNLNGNIVVISGLNEAFTVGQSQNYFLAADYNMTAGAVPGSIQFSFASGQSVPAFTQSAPVNGTTYNNLNLTGNTFNLYKAIVNVTSAQNGLSGGTITAGQTEVAMFGFGITSTPTIALSNMTINSDNSTLDTYFTNGKLYTCATNTYNASARTLVGTVTFSGADATVNFTTPLSVSSTVKYYFLVADNKGGVSPTTSFKFRFVSGQPNAAVTESSPDVTTYNNFTFNGNSYTLPAPTINYSVNTTGYTTGSTIVVGQKAVLYGVTVSATGNISIPSAQINYNTPNNPTGYFTNFELWVSTTGTYADATQVSGVSFGNIGGGLKAGLPGSSLDLTAGSSLTYYLVGKLVQNSGLPLTFPISSAGVYGNSGGSSTYATSSLSTTTYTLVTATVAITGNNTATAGITQGSLSPGQNGIVLFSFKMVAQGDFTMGSMSIPSTGDMGHYFTNGQIYRSTSPIFSSASPLSGVSVNFGSGSSALISSFNQVFTASTPTTYYYFLVADFSTVQNMPATTVQYGFNTSQNPKAINSGSGSGDSFNNFTVTDGRVFKLINVYKWIGTTSDFTDKNNFRDIQGSPVGQAPGSAITVEIGVASYTTQPIIPNNTPMNIGGLTFGSATTPTLTLGTGSSLYINDGLNAVNGSNAKITSTGGTISIAGSASSSVVGSSTLTLDGALAVSNAGVYDISPTSRFNLTNNATFANNGTFTLASSATSSATVGQLAGTSAMTGGGYAVQRFITGGTGFDNARNNYTYRNYRLMSSPVSNGTDTYNYYNLQYIANSAIVTGATGGYTSGGNPTLYLYKENYAGNTSSFTSGNYRGVTGITPSTSKVDGADVYLYSGQGFLFYFRGDKINNLANKTTAPYPAPENVVFTNTGTLNQGNIKVYYWFDNTQSLNYSTTATKATQYGLNLVGNPYPSSINWDTSDGTGITLKNVSNTIYEFNEMTNQYGTYQAGTTGTGGITNIIASGQGFFVQATGTQAELTFTEGAKTSAQPSTLLMGKPDGFEDVKRYLKLKLMKDSLNYDDVAVVFKSNATATYNQLQDAFDLGGNGALESLSVMSGDNVGTAIKCLPFPKKQSTTPLLVDATTTGNYTLSLSALINIPDVYQIWLKDGMTKDSIDLRKQATYSFKIDKSNAATYGTGRFTLIIKLNNNYQFLSLTGAAASNGVKLQWKTSNESYYVTFTAERSTDGGKTYDPINSMQSDSTGIYNLLDKNVTTGIYKYRIKQDDINNNITYSPEATVAFYSDPSTGISVYPNPTHNTLNISVEQSSNAPATNTYTINIVSTTGKLIKTYTSTQSIWNGDVTDLLPGIYIIQVVSNTTQQVVGRSKFSKI